MKGQEMKREYITLLLFIVLCVGCAGQRINLVDPTGRVIPTPHYMLQSTSNLNIQTVSYWATFKLKTDLDGSTIQHPTFIPYTEDYKFSRRNYSHAILTIEVKNPNQIEYKLVERVTFIRNHKRSVKFNRKVVGVSNLPYRQYSIKLPFQKKDIGKIQYGVDLMLVDDYPIMHFGNLNYKLTK